MPTLYRVQALKHELADAASKCISDEDQRDELFPTEVKAKSQAFKLSKEGFDCLVTRVAFRKLRLRDFICSLWRQDGEVFDPAQTEKLHQYWATQSSRKKAA